MNSIEKPDLFETIIARHSVRAYAPEIPDRDTIQTLLDAAVHAPTAMHEEPWAFVVVQNKALLQQVSDIAKPLFIERLHQTHRSSSHVLDDNFNIFHDAGMLIVICAKPSGIFVEADCWLAVENLMLAACALGLGSCVIGSAVAALNMPEIKEKLGIPADYSAVAPIIVGVPAGETHATARKEPLILTWQ